MPAPRRSGERSVTAELASHARVRPVNNLVGVGKYFHSAELLLRQADFYRLQGNDAQLYVFLMRFASLVVDTLPKHQDFRPEDPKYKRLRKRLLNEYMSELEQIKLRLNLSSKELPTQSSYRYAAHRPAEAVQTSLTPLPGLDWARFTPSYGTALQSGSATQAVPAAGWPESLDLLSGSGSNGAVPSATPTLTNLLSHEASSSSRLPAASSETLQRHALLPSPGDQRRQLVAVPAQRPLYPEFDATPMPPCDYRPAPPSAPPQPGGQPHSLSLMDAATVEGSAPPPPPLPAQLTEDLQQQVATNVKPRLELQLGPQEMPVNMVSPLAGDLCCAPQPDKSPLDKDFEGVRDVNVSVALMEDFMRLCVANTRRNIETIGLLGGSLSADGASFNIDTLILPKQKGETDRVEMLAEEEIWDIFFQEDQSAAQSTFPVGWIHTHPAFDCFLSSVDIHNQYGYQVMLEEAVAVVMSPRDSQNRKCGIFRLTTPGGMGLIRDCMQTGFHTHPPTATGQKIYELCGHVYINPRVHHKVVDLRT